MSTEELARQVGTLKAMIRVNALRWFPRVSHAEIDAQIETAIGAPVPAGTEIPKIAAAAWTAGYHAAERFHLANPAIMVRKKSFAPDELARLQAAFAASAGGPKILQRVELAAAPGSQLLWELHRVCREYEQGGFSNPGRAIDEVRDALGRREDGFVDRESPDEGEHEEAEAPARAATPEEPQGGAPPLPGGGPDGERPREAAAAEGGGLQQPQPEPAGDRLAHGPVSAPSLTEIAMRAERALASTPDLNSLIHAAFGRDGWTIDEWVRADQELRERGAPCPSIMGVPDYMGSLDAGRRSLPEGCFLRIGNDGEGPDPSLYLAELVGPLPARERSAARALTLEGSLVSASLRLLAATCT